MKKYLILFVILYSLSADAQMGWWTWMHGSNSPAAAAVSGTLGVPAITNTPGALYQTCEWTDLQGNFWIYGGTDGNFIWSDLWKYNPTADTWTKIGAYGSAGVYGTQGIPSPTNHPGGRAFGAATWVDASGNLWLFGGGGYDDFGTIGDLGDLWKYDIPSNTWTWMSGLNTVLVYGFYGTKGVPDPMNAPPGRSETNACWSDSLGNLWLFGGMCTYSFVNHNMNDLWKYDVSTNLWTWMKGSDIVDSPGSYGVIGVPDPTNEPRSRNVYSKWKDKNGNFWLFGGQNKLAGELNDLWKYDLSSNNWSWMRGSNIGNPLGLAGPLCISSDSYDPPGLNETKACWTDKCGNFWLYGGGRGYNFTTTYEALWHYSVQTNRWILTNGLTSASTPGNWGAYQIPSATNHPNARAGSASFTDSLGNFWMFGGSRSAFSATGIYNDLWRFVIDSTCASSCAQINSNFTATTLAGCSPLTVQFLNSSINATGYSWNFGDGGTSTAANPSYTFNSSGSYTVMLIAYNGVDTDTTTFINYIYVYPEDTANYSVSYDSVCIGNTLSFTNTSTNASMYLWNFGNGATDTLENPTNSWTTTGQYTVTLIAYSTTFGCPDTISSQIFVVSNSVSSDFSANPLSDCSPLTVQFINNSSSISSCYWEFGDGTTSTFLNPSHTYGQGVYDVTLITYNNSTMLCPMASDTMQKIAYIVSDSCQLFIPNVFSPNTDGENDLFNITAIGYSDFELEIYNRWGEKIFISKSNTNQWNGKINNNGEEQTDGTYYYILNLKSSKGVKSNYKGFISLIR